jgi:hypothetical protein
MPELRACHVGNRSPSAENAGWLSFDDLRRRSLDTRRLVLIIQTDQFNCNRSKFDIVIVL